MKDLNVRKTATKLSGELQNSCHTTCHASNYKVAGSIAEGSFSTPFHPIGRALTASLTGLKPPEAGNLRQMRLRQWERYSLGEI